MFDGLGFALRGGDAQICQKFEAEPLLQFAGRCIESVTAALDEIHLLSVEKFFGHGADGFSGIAFSLRFPADAKRKSLPLFALQLRQGSKGSRKGAHIQVADEPPAGLFDDAVKARPIIRDISLSTA